MDSPDLVTIGAVVTAALTALLTVLQNFGIIRVVRERPNLSDKDISSTGEGLPPQVIEQLNTLNQILAAQEEASIQERQEQLDSIQVSVVLLVESISKISTQISIQNRQIQELEQNLTAVNPSTDLVTAMKRLTSVLQQSTNSDGGTF